MWTIMQADNIIQLAAFLAAFDRTTAETLQIDEIDKVDIDALIMVLKKNKVPLISLDTKRSDICSRIVERPAFKEAIKAEHSFFTMLRGEYAKVQEELLKSGVENILFKSIGPFPYESDNIDSLVRPKHVKIARSILSKMGYVELKNCERPHKFLFRKFHKGQEVATYHLHDSVCWGGPAVLNLDVLWQRCRRSEEDSIVTIPSSEESFLITVAHLFYENRNVKIADLNKIAHCLGRQYFDWEFVVEAAQQRGWDDGFYLALLMCESVYTQIYGESLIPEAKIVEVREKFGGHGLSMYSRRLTQQRGIADMPFKFSKVVSKIYFFRHVLREPEIGVIRRCSGFSRTLLDSVRILLRLPKQPGMLICLSGVDGSGKTAHSEALSSAFVNCGIRTRYLWSRGGYSSTMGALKSLVRLFVRNKASENYGTENKRIIIKGMFSRHLWQCLVTLDMLREYFFGVSIPLMRNKVVICDRYVADTIVDLNMRFSTNAMTRLVKKVLTSLCPSADISYFLDVPAETAFNRKSDELSVEDLRERVELYHQMTMDSNFVVKDTTPEFETVNNEIIFEILIKYFGTYPDKYRNWPL